MEMGKIINAKLRFDMMDDKFLEFGAAITEEIESLRPSE
jgi:hypothetical protein